MSPPAPTRLETHKPQLSLEHVSKIYGPKPEAALERFKASGHTGRGESLGLFDVSLSIPQGQFFVLMGLSGSGKSTLLRLLNGLHEPTAGRIKVGDTYLDTLGRRALISLRRKLFSGMVFQGFALLPHRTVLGNVTFGLELQHIPKPERLSRAQEVLRLVGLGELGERYPRELSGGMQQRLGLARALVLGGDVLLMDEPFSALDPITRRELQGELLSLQQRLQKTIVLVTHDMDEALRLGDRVALLKGGQVQQVGTPEEIVMQPANSYIASFVAGVDKTAVLTAGSVMHTPVSGAAVPEHRIGPETPLRDVVRLTAHHAGVAVVGEGGQLLGTITPQNVLAALGSGA